MHSNISLANVGDRRFRFYDHQNDGVGIELTLRDC
jgi:hypothetical protein